MWKFTEEDKFRYGQINTIVIDGVMLKRCTRCGMVRPMEDFGKNNSRPGGVHYCCKKCTMEMNREYRRSHPEAIKESRKKYVFKNSEMIAECKRNYAKKIAAQKRKEKLDKMHIEGEVWEEVEEAGCLYSVSNMGRVRREDNLHVMSMIKTGEGYKVLLTVGGKATRFMVHELVAGYFIPIPGSGKYVVQHKNNDMSNNAASNLEYVLKKSFPNGY